MENSMAEENQNAAPVKVLSMTTAAIRKRESRARIAAREDAALPEEAREERAKARVQAQWKANWEALTQAEKDEFNEVVRNHNETEASMGEVAHAVSDGKELTGEDIQFFKNIFVDAEALAAQYPPTDDALYLQAQYSGIDKPDFTKFESQLRRHLQAVYSVSDKFDFLELEPQLEKYPPSFRLYGVPVDHIHGPSYAWFLCCFSKFYRKYRNAGIAEPAEEFAISWEKVDELVRKNKRLSGESSFIRCYFPESAVVVSTTTQPRPLSEVELIQKAVSERHAASLGIQE
jgi:hypothetical protein